MDINNDPGVINVKLYLSAYEGKVIISNNTLKCR